MKKIGGYSRLLKFFRDFSRRLPTSHVHDTGTGHRLKNMNQLTYLIFCHPYHVREVFARETHPEDIAFLEEQFLLDIFFYPLRSGCR